MKSLEQLIAEYVEDKQGCRAVELAAEPQFAVNYDFETMSETLNRMVQQGELIEIEYVLPKMNDRIKSIYLPKGTRVEVLGI